MTGEGYVGEGETRKENGMIRVCKMGSEEVLSSLMMEGRLDIKEGGKEGAGKMQRKEGSVQGI